MSMVRENSSTPAQLRTYGAMVTHRMFMDTVANGGTTVDLGTFKIPAKTDGFFVGSARKFDGSHIQTVVISREDFSLRTLRRAFGFLYAEHLTRGQIESSAMIHGGYIGTWRDEAGDVHVDACNWTADRAEAIQWAQERGEDAIYDVASNGSLMMSQLMMEVMAA